MQQDDLTISGSLAAIAARDLAARENARRLMQVMSEEERARYENPSINGIPFTAAMGTPTDRVEARQASARRMMEEEGREHQNPLTSSEVYPNASDMFEQLAQEHVRTYEISSTESSNVNDITAYTEEEARRMYETFVQPIETARQAAFDTLGIPASKLNENPDVTKSMEIADKAKEKIVLTKYSRFKDAPWFGDGEHVLIGGAGGIGSWLALFLSRAGFKPIVYDFDVIEEHNMGGQFFRKKNIGKTKTFALSELIGEFCDSSIDNINEAYGEDSMVNEYTFSAFDNNAARKIMFNKWRMEYEGNPNAIFIDARLLFEQLTIFVIPGTDYDRIEEYLSKNLPDDSTIANEPCSQKQTTHTAAHIAAQMVEFFTNFLTMQKSEDELKLYLPFKWEYLVPLGEIPT